MLLLKRFSLSSLKHTRCHMCQRSLTAKPSSSSLETTQEPLEDDDKFAKYADKLLYNSVIESQQVIRSYTANKIVSFMEKRLEVKLRTAMQTIQPLPLTLKYYSDELHESTSSEPSKDDNSCSEVLESNVPTNFPYSNVSSKVDDVSFKKPENISIKKEIIAKKEWLDGSSKDNWMSYYENFIEEINDDDAEISEPEPSKGNINYGTPDREYPVSDTPCGGCGAYLHCQDISIPGYLPSEIFKNCFTPIGANLQSVLCQRCHFLKEYNIALQVRVSPDDYPKVLQTISFSSGTVLLLVDLTDFPCSIWPGLADIIGPKTPIVVVGNKVDLLPKDQPKFLQNIKQVLVDNLKCCGFGAARIKHVELISAKTGYGVESLISSLHQLKRRGDVYLIGCTNVGKSTLFNSLLKSDFCKVQAAELVQRATTSVWPGTTLNLLKFPITKFTAARMEARQKRLKELKEIEDQEKRFKKEALSASGYRQEYATLSGLVGRTFQRTEPERLSLDSFVSEGRETMRGQTVMGINEKHPDFVLSKWCYDTPGVVHPDQILHLLTTQELVKTLPKQLIRPQSFCVKPGTTLFIAGLARLDFVDGPRSVRLTVFRSSSLPITVCHTEEADSVYGELIGTELFGVPIFESDRAANWPGLELAKTFTVCGKTDKESSYDVVLSSAGWVSINCNSEEYHFQAWTPEKRGVHIRDCLLPKAVQLRGGRIRRSVAYQRHRLIV